MKQLAVVVHQFPVVSETFVADHVVGLGRHGWEPVVVCGDVDAPLLSSLQARAAVTFRTERVCVPHWTPRQLMADVPGLLAVGRRAPRVLSRPGGLAIVRRAVALRHALSRLSPAVIHAHFADFGMSAAMAAARHRPVIVDFHGWDFNAFAPRFGWDAVAQALRGCTLVAHSDFARGRIEAGVGAPVRKVRLGVDLESFRGPERPPSWPARLRWLVVGRLVRSKGQEVALRALALARAADPRMDAVLTLAGDGPDLLGLQKLASELGLREHVRFTGALSPPEVAAEMARSDVLIVPSIRTPDGAEEAFGRVAIEGLASGLPVVTSGIGGLAEAVGDAGWTLPESDPMALASCIRQLIAAWTPAQCRERSLTRAAAFSIERMWRDYADVVDAVSVA